MRRALDKVSGESQSRDALQRGEKLADVFLEYWGSCRRASAVGNTSMHRRSRFVLYAAVLTAVTAATSCTQHALGLAHRQQRAGPLAPDPAKVKEAVVQVYGARTYGAKGLFGVHTWVAVKPADAEQWTVYEVVGWRLRSSPSAIVVHSRPPDARS